MVHTLTHCLCTLLKLSMIAYTLLEMVYSPIHCIGTLLEMVYSPIHCIGTMLQKVNNPKYCELEKYTIQHTVCALLEKVNGVTHTFWTHSWERSIIRHKLSVHRWKRFLFNLTLCKNTIGKDQKIFGNRRSVENTTSGQRKNPFPGVVWMWLRKPVAELEIFPVSLAVYFWFFLQLTMTRIKDDLKN